MMGQHQDGVIYTSWVLQWTRADMRLYLCRELNLRGRRLLLLQMFEILLKQVLYWIIKPVFWGGGGLYSDMLPSYHEQVVIGRHDHEKVTFQKASSSLTFVILDGHKVSF